ncbi:MULTISPECIES: hypothetical protein [Calothrix]|uniref:TMhelix containing protein n=2 Tax=Calothrix TaxID=1186 RepID=A0ABR8AGR2_9CYAN|nr:MULTISPECIES: hypothetical protein [Calothrix]MBD2197737.1 hypothetical protein [Calothrix parietina FACHB-288]MBD2226141.1 hypothetical protein [Calothrix anomala FACHB-343]
MTAKKLMAVLFFLIPLIADLLFPGSGIAIELAILIWELLESDETQEE